MWVTVSALVGEAISINKISKHLICENIMGSPDMNPHFPVECK